MSFLPLDPVLVLLVDGPALDGLVSEDDGDGVDDGGRHASGQALGEHVPALRRPQEPEGLRDGTPLDL